MLVQFDDDKDEDADTVSSPDKPAASKGPAESANNAEKESDDEDALFIPLAWSRLEKGELYATSDPEWQEFVKLSKDREKLQALRGKRHILW